MDIPANIINGIMMNSILESILDDDCQAHDDDGHEYDNEIGNCGHSFTPVQILRKSAILGQCF
jgi:hypothetical protein